MKKNKLIVILGPTAIGKTAVSIELAKHFNCPIISCDSRQFYVEMTIGTAVPSLEELNYATHYFIQNKSIFENYTVGDFEKEALKKLDKIFETNEYAIIVGGSGLYLDAVLKGFDVFPEIETDSRAQVLINYNKFGIEYLQEKLKELDIEYFNKISLENPQSMQNPQRMMRFVEVCIGTGKPYSSFLNKNKNERNFTPIIIGLQADKEQLYQRINSRVEVMINNGLLAEAERLYPYRNLNALQTVGYKELFDFFDHTISLEFAIDEIKKNTRRFAKRQITWFKRTENVVWFDYQTSINKIIAHLKSIQ